MTPYVYAITDGASIKIGVARRPQQRCKALSTGNATKLTMLGYFPGGFDLEKQLHQRFASSRGKGEWFKPSPDLIEYLNENITDRLVVVENGVVRFYPKLPTID